MSAAPFLSAIAVLLSAAPAAAQHTSSLRPADRARVLLQRRASRPVPLTASAVTTPSTPSGHLAPILPGPGKLLFSMVGADNAECVRATPDVTGDGRDEIVVGIGKSGQPNVFCLDGASNGTASFVWSLETDGGVSGGSCYGDRSIVPVSDTEGNGHANVLVGTGWGGRTGYDLDALDGAETWRFDTYQDVASGWVYSMCEVSDMNGDGVPEYVLGVGSDGDAAILVDGAEIGSQATVIWRYAAGDVVYDVRNLGDVDADGKDDVLAAVGDNVDRIVCLEGDSTLPGGHVLWNHNPFASVWACGTLSDVTGDGVKEALAVLWTLGGSSIRCLNGATGALVWSSTQVPDYGMSAEEIGDVTGDGKNDVIVGSWENAVIVLSGADGSLVWKTPVGSLNGGDVWTVRAIDDLDGDGLQDVIAGSFDYHVYAMDGTTGTVFWAYNTGNRVFSVAPTGDLDGDHWPDVAAGTQDTTSSVVVRVLSGFAGVH